jgi:hypothetical protein
MVTAGFVIVNSHYLNISVRLLHRQAALDDRHADAFDAVLEFAGDSPSPKGAFSLAADDDFRLNMEKRGLPWRGMVDRGNGDYPGIELPTRMGIVWLFEK